MKILILNGSPRQGNTLTAVNAFVDGASQKNTIEKIDTYHVNVGQCTACDICKCQYGCIAKDDTNNVVNKIVDADMIVVASPVYSWGLTARVKTIIEKCYCRDQQVKNKKLGVIIVGAEPVSNLQYAAIKEQFSCLCGYMKWNAVFFKCYSAAGPSDLAKDGGALRELSLIGLKL